MQKRERRNKPLVSVIMICYNCDKFLKFSLDSFFNQSYNPKELIFVDDNSTDNTEKIIKKYLKKHSNLIYIKNKKRIGIGKSRNKGLKNIKRSTKYIAILDSDDIYLKNKLKISIDFLEKNKDIDVLGTDIFFIDEFNRIIGKKKYKQDPKKCLFLQNPFAHSTVVFRKSILKTVKGYDPKINIAEDYDFWFRVLARHKGFVLNRPLTKYRISSFNSKKNKTKKTLFNTIKLKIKYAYKYKHISFYFFVRLFFEILLLFFPQKFIYNLFLRINGISLKNENQRKNK